MLAASLLPLARPEGVFLCLIWGMWVLAKDIHSPTSPTAPLYRNLIRTVPSTLILAAGVFSWWIAATCITRDPLFILHNWPATWHQGVYGRGTLLSYSQRALEFTGLPLAVPFVLGLWCKMRAPNWIPLTTSFLLFFVLHTVFRACGLFGEAGYPRYMVSVAPAIAVLSLAGWNAIAWRTAPWPRFSGVLGSTILIVSLVQNFLYLDSFSAARDPIAIREMAAWLQEHPKPYQRMVWSNARMCIVSGLTLVESPSLNSPRREDTLALLRKAPSGTLVFWDNHFGPDWFGLTAGEIEENGYQRVRTRAYSLPGVVIGDAGRRDVELSLLFKP
jgi:hypothetical protein